MEENLTNATEQTETQETETVNWEEKYQALMTENARLKKATDKATSEAANYKKQLREKQSADEIAMQEKAEQEAERLKELEELRREKTVSTIEKNYLKLGYLPDEAQKMAIAEADGDSETRFAIMASVDERKHKEFVTEQLKNRPLVNTGSNGAGNTLTKQQIMSIKDRDARQKAIAENFSLFKN